MVGKWVCYGLGLSKWEATLRPQQNGNKIYEAWGSECKINDAGNNLTILTVSAQYELQTDYAILNVTFFKFGWISQQYFTSKYKEYDQLSCMNRNHPFKIWYLIFSALEWT